MLSTEKYSFIVLEIMSTLDANHVLLVKSEELIQDLSRRKEEVQDQFLASGIQRSLSILEMEFEILRSFLKQIFNEECAMNFENEITRADSNPLPLDCIGSHHSVSKIQARIPNQTWQEVERMVFDFQKFVREKIFQIIEQGFPERNVPLKLLKYSCKNIEINGVFFREQTLESVNFPGKYKHYSDIREVIDDRLWLLKIPGLNKSFFEILTGDEDVLNMYIWTRNRAIWMPYHSSYQIFHLPLKANSLTSSKPRNTREVRQIKNSLKPDKNVYPFLFSWIIEILQNEGEHLQNDEAIFGEVSRLAEYRDKFINEMKSTEMNEDLQQFLASLEQADLKVLVRNRNNWQFQLSALKEQCKISKQTITEYYQDYKSNPSFKKILKVHDEKEIYFWISLMAIILKELPLESSLIVDENCSFVCCMLRRPDLGSKLKINLLSFEMRKHYYRSIKEVQNTLLRKCEERKAMKDFIKTILTIIGENPNKLEAENGYHPTKGRKRHASCNLQEQEQEFRPIDKIRVSEPRSLREVPIIQMSSQPKRIPLLRLKEMFRQKLVVFLHNLEIQRQLLLFVISQSTS